MQSTCSRCGSIHRIFAFDQVLGITLKKKVKKRTRKVANALLNTTENRKVEEKRINSSLSNNNVQYLSQDFLQQMKRDKNNNKTGIRKLGANLSNRK